MSRTPAGWYPDADGVTRWWDGTQWTEHIRPGNGPPPPERKGRSPALWAGLGGGLLAVAAVVVLVLVLGRGSDDEKSPSSADDGVTASPRSATGSTATSQPLDAADAPKHASTAAFCRSFDLERLFGLSSSSNGIGELASLQHKMLEVGTPAGMPADARRGWEWFAGLDSPADAASMNQKDLSALGSYYRLTCG